MKIEEELRLLELLVKMGYGPKFCMEVLFHSCLTESIGHGYSKALQSWVEREKDGSPNE